MKRKQEQIYIILSVDTEHPIVSRYKTRSAGWADGIPLLFQAFDAAGVKGKVCWLIEYNIKEGIPAANARSEFFIEEFPELIAQIKDRGDELGLHPQMIRWLGGENDITAKEYLENRLWNKTRHNHDQEFVMNLITTGVKELTEATGSQPIGCRVARVAFGNHLADALEKNNIYVDSTLSTCLSPWIAAPNAYYADEKDIRKKATKKAGVLEIPTTGYIRFDSLLKEMLLKARIQCFLQQKQPMFLSYYIHNWQAIDTDDRPNTVFLERLPSFLRSLQSCGACFLSWAEAYQVYADLYEKELQKTD